MIYLIRVCFSSQDLRSLQDQVNATIESAQKLTADPKTDTRLGKVGRWRRKKDAAESPDGHEQIINCVNLNLLLDSFLLPKNQLNFVPNCYSNVPLIRHFLNKNLWIKYRCWKLKTRGNTSLDDSYDTVAYHVKWRYLRLKLFTSTDTEHKACTVVTKRISMLSVTWRKLSESWQLKFRQVYSI